MMRHLVFVAIVLFVVTNIVSGFVSHRINNIRVPRVKPVHENFFLDIPTTLDSETTRVPELRGEAAYKNFVESYKPEALILGGEKYEILTRVRQLKLLSATADSGLLEALEAKGLTLSQVEKLLPVVDDLGLLPLAVKNKDLVLSLAPLLIEPAPALLPLVVSLLRTSPATFSTAGAVLVGLGVVESLDNVLLGAPLALLGAPLVLLGAVLGGSISLPLPESSGSGVDINAPSVKVSGGSRPVAAAKRPSAAKTVAVSTKPTTTASVKATKAPVVKVATAKGSAPEPVVSEPTATSKPTKAAVKVATKATSSAPTAVKAAGSNSLNGKRKVIKIK